MLTVRVSTPNDGFECYYLDDENGREVASINGPQSIDGFRLASQMAAAPEMFAILEEMAGDFMFDEFTDVGQKVLTMLGRVRNA